MGKRFKRLERKIKSEYERRGYGMKRSKYIADATAGKIYRMQLHDAIRYPGEH